MNKKLDDQEKEIVRQLIINPRNSDNQISKITGIPLKSVNRKRKKLEEEGYIQYFTYLDTSSIGTGDFSTRQEYTVTFKPGMTRKRFLENNPLARLDRSMSKHILEAHLGEKDGKLALILIIESRIESDTIEIINAEIIPKLTKHFNEPIVEDISNVRLSNMLRLLHNYTPIRNVKSKLIPDAEDQESLFITDQS
ncbi:MAG: winged helix-turn-helix domain-containing protein [Candidatus Woesearchaeota archaeon]